MFTVYETATGAIKFTLVAPDFLLEANVPDGCSALLGEYGDHMYRVDINSIPHVAVEKTVINYSINKQTIEPDGEDAATITGLPENTAMKCEGNREVVSGSATFSADHAGTYEITFIHPLYLPTVIEIIAK